MTILDETVEALAKFPNNYADCARYLGIHPSTFLSRLRRYGLTKKDPSHMETIVRAISLHPLSMRNAAAAAKMPYRTFIERAKRLGVYAPNPNHLGRTFPNGGKGAVPLKEILEGKHPSYRTVRLKQRMIQEGMISEVCDGCGLGPEWNGKPITLELDHINGNSKDHRRENLRILCPNCHSQTPTFRGRKLKAPVS